MPNRLVIVLVATLPVIAAGCATKKFVREEIGKTEAKVGADVGRVEGSLSEERTRVAALSGQLGETRTAVDTAGKRAEEAAGLAQTAQGRADDAVTRAAAAQARADEANGVAAQALTKANDTDSRLTRLWTNRNKRIAGDTLAVLFRFNRSDLDDRAETSLLDVVKQLQESPNLVVELEGYTDSSGIRDYNVQLAQRRAETVRRFLVEKGVELQRVHSIGLGDIKPVAENTSPKGREQNRRVMVRTFAPHE